MEKTEIMQFLTKNLVYAIKGKKAIMLPGENLGRFGRFRPIWFFLVLAYYLFICTDFTF